jgi:hypothetical protein
MIVRTIFALALGGMLAYAAIFGAQVVATNFKYHDAAQAVFMIVSTMGTAFAVMVTLLLWIILWLTRPGIRRYGA